MEVLALRGQRLCHSHFFVKPGKRLPEVKAKTLFCPCVWSGKETGAKNGAMRDRGKRDSHE